MSLQSFIRRRRNKARDPKQIVFITTPKSGTLFLSEAFKIGPDLPHQTLTPGYFPHDHFDEWQLQKIEAKSFVAVSHAAPSRSNRRLLQSYFHRWHVHLRDPRSVVLSWTHHIKNYAASGVPLNRHLAYICWDGPEDDGFLDWDFERLLDWNLRHFLPIVVAWQRDWLKIGELVEDKMLLTTYADLLNDSEGYLARIAEHFNVPSEDVIAYSQTHTNRHYRTGRPDEWTDVFSAAQKDMAEVEIGKDLIEITNSPLLER